MNEETQIVGLASAIESLRDELEAAWLAGEGRAVRFRASEVNLKLQVAARREKDGSAKVRWWIIEAGAGAKGEHEATQTLEITLTPKFYDEHGRATSLDVSGAQEEPGE